MVLILCIENSKNVRIRLQLITNLQNELVDPLILNTVYIVIVQFLAEHKNNPLLKNMLFKHWKMHSLKKNLVKSRSKDVKPVQHIYTGIRQYIILFFYT